MFFALYELLSTATPKQENHIPRLVVEYLDLQSLFSTKKAIADDGAQTGDLSLTSPGRYL